MHCNGTPFSITNWLHDAIMPQPGTTPTDDIMCYGLPFGGLGMLSHILTFYTVLMLLLGKKPLLPPGGNLEHSLVELILRILTLLGSLPIAALTMFSCRSRWQFVCLAVWKLTLSVTLAAINSHQGTIMLRSHQRLKNQGGIENTEDPLNSKLRSRARLTRATLPTLSVSINWRKQKGVYWWLSTYVVGTIIGLAGLISLTITYYDANVVTVKGFTNALALFVGSLFVFWVIYLFFLGWSGEAIISSLIGITALMGLVCAIYSDWILASITKNWGGVPSSDIELLFWIYFIAKRLPMLSI